jgi:hypothetical protein
MPRRIGAMADYDFSEATAILARAHREADPAIHDKDLEGAGTKLIEGVMAAVTDLNLMHFKATKSTQGNREWLISTNQLRKGVVVSISADHVDVGPEGPGQSHSVDLVYDAATKLLVTDLKLSPEEAAKSAPKAIAERIALVLTPA